MNKRKILKKAEELIKKHFVGEKTGHDWWHIDRVRKNAIRIARMEPRGDLFIIELAALTHDLDDWKFRTTKEPVNTLRILRKSGVDEESIARILEITENISFKLGTNKVKMKTIEGKITQDADRLDAIGAIGIARLFTFGGSMGREIYNPEKKLVKYKTLNKLDWKTNTSLHHFDEKLLHIKKRMNTKSGKQLAARRHQFMLRFLDQFHREWKNLQ